MSRVRIVSGDLAALHQKMCKMMDEVFSRTPLGMSQGWRPAVNIYEEAERVVLVAELAGVEPEGIEITLDGPIVRLAGSRSVACLSQPPLRYHQLEIDHGRFERLFRLPVAVDSAAAQATLKDGYLYVSLPKRRSEARSISVERS